ncbi:hypothetical protein BO78DRAFT_398782 [Aspergillus sclerotiicarbonarius CBS 121057]|uniref:Aminoglycoside phosphotransferase domain-containing protein n=1 Tax=Aspergillus sclerotiicarbonarius (strain CBS 121057 / IBT 28362) TaxID=1448318 RepID=A0A319E3M6_ASPSB|nr:hypothetical protein BO78DRAFT_398782 [Aspergillus sclerotiicarbonarius CBS 121057]
MVLHSGSWFDSKWIGKIVHFETPSYSWRITAKLQEYETRYLQSEFKLCGFYSEASCAFVCEDLEGSAQAIMKIRMQIPYIEEDPNSSIPSSEQALTGLSGHTEREIKALRGLTKAGCSCTPHYITSKHEDQGAGDCIPGGFLEYLVMEKVEGIKLSHDILDRLDAQRQIKLREAFRSSYLECHRCGFINLNPNPENLIWNAAKAKCYIVNWESWCKKAKWSNGEFRWWGLEFD